MTKRGLKKLLVRALVALAVAFLSAEVLLRLFLFSDAASIARIGERLRREHYFAHWQTQESYALRAVFSGDEAHRRNPLYDAQLGARSKLILTEPYRHADEPLLRGRRPLLMYGDSFTACTTGTEYCWQGIVEQSPFAADFCVLNFGVGGYGVDQMLLLLRATIDRYEAQDPLVVVGILVDDDLDRSAFGLREFPKPRFELVDGRLELRPGALTAADYLRAEPLAIKSYAWRFLLHAKHFPAPLRRSLMGENRLAAARRELNRALIEAIRSELIARDLDYFFVLFHGQRALYSIEPYTWREPFLYEVFGDLQIPFVSSKRALLEDAARTGHQTADYFIQEGHGRNHYTPEANRAAAAALFAGLRGEFESNAYLSGAPAHPRTRR